MAGCKIALLSAFESLTVLLAATLADCCCESSSTHMISHIIINKFYLLSCHGHQCEDVAVVSFDGVGTVGMDRCISVPILLGPT